MGAIGLAQEESCCFERKMGWRDWRTLIKLGGVSKRICEQLLVCQAWKGHCKPKTVSAVLR